MIYKRINWEAAGVDQALAEIKACGFTRECVKNVMAKYKDNSILKEAIKHCNFAKFMGIVHKNLITFSNFYAQS